MKKQYLKLTEDQKARGIIFSSQLLPGSIIHEVEANDPDKDRQIRLLVDDSFFNNSPYKKNQIRQ